jgi:hypothetical protein
MEVYPGITMDPAIRFGNPCITGTRIDVATVLGRLAPGDKVEEIQEIISARGIKSWRLLPTRHMWLSIFLRPQIGMIILPDENFPLRPRVQSSPSLKSGGSLK